MNTTTPPPRLVPDRPSAWTIRQTNYRLWMETNGDSGCEPTAAWRDGYLAALSAAPPAEAPAERGELLAEFLWNRFADENEIDWSDAHSKGQWRLIASDALAMLAAAPAAPAVVYDDDEAPEPHAPAKAREDDAKDARRYRMARRFLTVSTIKRGVHMGHSPERHAQYLADIDAEIDAALATFAECE